jgi:hypothetical protein
MAKKNSTNKQDLSDDQFEKLANFQPAFDKETMMELERVAGCNGIGINRRVSLAALTQSAESLANFSMKEPETYGETLDCAEAFLTHAKGLNEMAEAALIRLQIADCRKASHEPA